MPKPKSAGAAPLHGSPVVRALFFVAGVVSLGLGIVGAFLPLLPTTPLVLLAATCFARSYRPFHEWLWAHRLFGPILQQWHEHRRVPPLAIVTAIAMITASIVVVWCRA